MAEVFLARHYGSRALKRSRMVKLPVDTYTGRILAAKLQVIDDVAHALGVEPTDDELGVLRDGYIERCRQETAAAVMPTLTPKATRATKLAKRREEKRKAAEQAERDRAAVANGGLPEAQ